VRELKADGSLPADMKLRSSKYLNNLIEQDHRSVKQRIAVMIGFKRFTNAAITITGIELMHRIRKGQFALARLGVQGQAVPTNWSAVTDCLKSARRKQDVSVLAGYLHRALECSPIFIRLLFAAQLANAGRVLPLPC
jgi:DDE domain